MLSGAETLPRVLSNGKVSHVQDSEYKLSARGMKVGSLHGDLNKAQRQNMLAGFKRGNIRALIVSDVAARGLDVADCDAVFNLELPSNAASYAHRAGRTCRAGR
jgi:superfamily II DNA/RNA helicase